MFVRKPVEIRPVGGYVDSFRFVFASFNAGKRREVEALLAPMFPGGVSVLSPTEFGLSLLPEETGSTFIENAVIKAAAAASASGLVTIADDSGLQVDALAGRPGVNSARYSGIEHDDAGNNRKLLAELAGSSDRTARFVCTAVMLVPPGGPVVAAGKAVPQEVTMLEGVAGIPEGWTGYCATGFVEGRIIDQPAGSDGFGYDPIFFRDDLGLTFAQIPKEEKNRLSHRGAAFSKIARLVAAMNSL